VERTTAVGREYGSIHYRQSYTSGRHGNVGLIRVHCSELRGPLLGVGASEPSTLQRLSTFWRVHYYCNLITVPYGSELVDWSCTMV